MNAEDPMETEHSSTQNDDGTPMDYEEQARISTVVILHCFMIYTVLIYLCATAGGEIERAIKTA